MFTLAFVTLSFCRIFALGPVFCLELSSTHTAEQTLAPRFMLHPDLNAWATIITIVLCMIHQALWSNCGKLLSELSSWKQKWEFSEETIMPEKELILKYYL